MWNSPAGTVSASCLHRASLSASSAVLPASASRSRRLRRRSNTRIATAASATAVIVYIVEYRLRRLNSYQGRAVAGYPLDGGYGDMSCGAVAMGELTRLSLLL